MAETPKSSPENTSFFERHRKRIYALITALSVTGAAYTAGEVIEVPLDDRPDAPMVPLRVRIKGDIFDMTRERPSQTKPRKEPQPEDVRPEPTPAPAPAPRRDYYPFEDESITRWG